jgi:hypothetical protein
MLLSFIHELLHFSVSFVKWFLVSDYCGVLIHPPPVGVCHRHFFTEQ